MRLLCFLFVLAATVDLASAQSSGRPAESVYVEVLGNTGAYSLNGDVLFPNGVGFRLGFMQATETTFSRARGYESERVGFAFLAMLHAVRGRGNHHAEIGAGVIAGGQNPVASSSERAAALTATMGYRYQRPGSGLVLRAGFTPSWAGGSVRPMVGLSLGYAFDALFR